MCTFSGTRTHIRANLVAAAALQGVLTADLTTCRWQSPSAVARATLLRPCQDARTRLLEGRRQTLGGINEGTPMGALGRGDLGPRGRERGSAHDRGRRRRRSERAIRQPQAHQGAESLQERSPASTIRRSRSAPSSRPPDRSRPSTRRRSTASRPASRRPTPRVSRQAQDRAGQRRRRRRRRPQHHRRAAARRGGQGLRHHHRVERRRRQRRVPPRPEDPGRRLAARPPRVRHLPELLRDAERQHQEHPERVHVAQRRRDQGARRHQAGDHRLQRREQRGVHGAGEVGGQQDQGSEDRLHQPRHPGRHHRVRFRRRPDQAVGRQLALHRARQRREHRSHVRR